MTAGGWLDVRLAGAPDPLAARLRALLGPALVREASELPGCAVEAAESLVSRLIREDCTGRDSALDLLAADALATFAFEAAADDPERLPARARAAMTRFAMAADAAERRA